MLEVDREIRDFVRKRIDEHRDTFDGDNVRDFIDLYLKTEQSGEESGAFTGQYNGNTLSSWENSYLFCYFRTITWQLDYITEAI